MAYMSSSTLVRYFAIIVAGLNISTSQGQTFLHQSADREVISRIIVEELSNAAQVNGGYRNSWDMTDVQAALSRFFGVLPKNSYGLVDASFMRYSVERYFLQRHGWAVSRFMKPALGDYLAVSLSGNNASYLVDEIFTQRHWAKGFSLEDLVAAITHIERLISGRGLESLEAAYLMRSRTVDQRLSRKHVQQMMKSYFILEHLAGSTEPDKHAFERRVMREAYPRWPKTEAFISDIIDTYSWQSSFANPFDGRSDFAFEDVLRITRIMRAAFGRFENEECLGMKARLVHEDPHATGRVAVANFWKGGAEFAESLDHLRQLGALDESSSAHGPQVLIANYMGGPTNCFSSTASYSVCCVSGCYSIMQHLETHIRNPTASAAQIIDALQQASPELVPHASALFQQGRIVNSQLKAKLENISVLHNDMIPLHGRLLAQWLHFMFPYECPYPHVSNFTTPSATHDDSMFVSFSQRLNASQAAAMGKSISPEAAMGMWSMEEKLVGHTIGSSKVQTMINVAKVLMRWALYLGTLALFIKETGLRYSLKEVSSFLAPSRQGNGKLIRHMV